MMTVEIVKRMKVKKIDLDKADVVKQFRFQLYCNFGFRIIYR